MYKLTVMAVSAATFLSAVGYGANRPDVSAAGRSSKASRAGSVSHPAAVSFQGFVYSRDGSALAGVDVCVYAGATDAAAPCTISRGDGSFALSARADERMIVALRKAGFASALRAIQTVANGDDRDTQQVAFAVTAPGEAGTAWVTRKARGVSPRAPLSFSVTLDRAHES